MTGSLEETIVCMPYVVFTEHVQKTENCTAEISPIDVCIITHGQSGEVYKSISNSR
jgi:hypothetical protein